MRSSFSWLLTTQRKAWLLLLSLSITVCLTRCGTVDKPEEVVQAEQDLPKELDYNLHVKPILSDKCFFCHGPDKAAIEAGLSLSDESLAFAKLESGNQAIVPGNLAKSEVFHRITADDPETIMPPPESNLSLTAYEKAVLLRWIEEGAEYKPHWAFIKPKKYELPEVEQDQWPKNPIDYFVLDKLEHEGLTPAPEADKETLLRRVSLDLTGLPPTVEEMDAFIADKSPNAYEKVVDRLLTSTHYGEKMATDWMDVSRFADTHGYTVDRYRPTWTWRDWVIQSFNKNMPFDQFTVWQLAGDLLPNATQEQKLATGFNRNHAQNMEGGIVNEEYRVEYVADRTNTLGTAFLGLTVECARCHDHKYDPISQKEYYSLFSFFNNIDEAGQISWDDALPVPTMLMPDEKQDSLIAFIDEKIKETEQRIANIRQTEKPVFEQQYEEGKLSQTNPLNVGLQAHFTLDRLQQEAFVNLVSTEQKGTLADAVLVEGKLGKAVKLNGDEELKLGKVGIFDRADPFSISLWVHIPEAQKNGVIFHKGEGAILYNFRGYHLALRDNKFELLMAHTWPYNNIIKLSEQEAPKEKWVHLTVTYDGSSKANGYRLFVDGQPMAMLTEKDNLYKGILFPALDHEPGLQIGARMRGVGFKNGLVDDIRVYERELALPEIADLAGYTPEPEAETTINGYFEAYLQQQVKAYQQQIRKLQQLRRQKNQITEEVPEVMVMDELKETRSSYLLERGVYDAHGEEVHPTTPASVLTFPDSLPQNRLGLAQWLMHPDNPLTSRVIVNRYWQTYFGRGLVKTAADFGNQGEMPSHPRLLDWLAVSFRESGWDIKAMQKMIVMSATYRQSSTVLPEQRKNDPENVLLARGPSARMNAEMLRDCALASSGLLTPTIGGPSVKPYQPEGLWAFNGGHYEPDTGDKLYRRSLYTFWKRTVPPPTMNTFDAPDRSYCIVKRQQTSTPLQALIMLNDPQFVEAARIIAQKVVQEEDQTNGRINHTFRLLTGRMPKPQERKILQDLLEAETAKFEKDPEKAEGWLSQGDSPTTSDASPVALASYTVLASTIMNSDAFITKR
uniref:DUF1553 domain-containing protein n=1 Tax=Roseihalotalea indica TaxID=2867963 RepID=A0AA49JEH2_9BACT|nr:DUF1553 domain-containing protein [Tunicatimonas sp. TK19036]